MGSDEPGDLTSNFIEPKLGAAGSHYARSVAPKHQGPLNLPDPSVIFESRATSHEFRDSNDQITMSTIKMKRKVSVTQTTMVAALGSQKQDPYEYLKGGILISCAE